MAIGAATEVGRIAGSLTSQERRRSPLQRELDRLVRILLVAALALIAFVTIAGFVRGRTLGENLLAGISAAIAAIPEEPPVLLAVILGLGAYRLLRRGVLVRRLNAEETLGAVDLIVTDKTGTLTGTGSRSPRCATSTGRSSGPTGAGRCSSTRSGPRTTPGTSTTGSSPARLPPRSTGRSTGLPMGMPDRSCSHGAT